MPVTIKAILIQMRPIFVKIFSKIQREEVNDNIGTYDSENNSMNGESISNFDRSGFFEQKKFLLFTYRVRYFRKYN